MTRKNKPLPKPPSTAFGGRRRFEETEGALPLIADEMAAAAAEGRIEEFLQREMPDNEHARSLAMMMMGMSGMLPPPQGLPSSQGEEVGEHPGKSPGMEALQEPSSAVEPPEEVLSAIQSGDVKGLMGLLEREHRKRNPDAGDAPTAAKGTGNTLGLSGVEKEVIERLIEIASENSLALDWIVLRALKLYAQEYGKTGRL